MWRIGIDTGGTNTDLIAIDESGRRRSAKTPSTPPEFELGIFDGLEKLGLQPEEVGLIVHGTTVTTNAIVTGRGARAALLTTKGFRDILELRRANREELYDLMWDPPPALVPRANRIEIDERTDYSGKVLRQVDPEQVRKIAAELREREIESVAICFLNSYANPENELLARDVLLEELPDCYVSASADILPQPPEFERTATVSANAYLGPILSGYLTRLESGLRERGFAADVLLMHSAGGVMSLDASKRLAVRTTGSGPAAGVVGAAAIGESIDCAKVISLDMGGTSCDVSVILDGQPRLTMNYELDWGMPVEFPSIDFVAVGAGGGSIAWLDSTQHPKSGPESAGANPGPACYGAGGDRPTTTDANLVLGRLSAEGFLGGDVRAYPERAREAISQHVAEQLDLDVADAAAGIVRIVDGTMASAVRLITVQKGFDPREFTMVAFGGAGPLHAVSVARELGIPQVVIPPEPGLTSALGLLFVDLVHDACQAYLIAEDREDLDEAEEILRRMEAELRERLLDEGAKPDAIKLTRFVDVRYVGQLHTITVPVQGERLTREAIADCVDVFHSDHEREYRYCRRDWETEISILRVEARADLPRPRLDGWEGDFEGGRSSREVYFAGEGWQSVMVVDRHSLPIGQRLEGPLIVEQYDSTVCMPPGTELEVDGNKNLRILTGAAG